MRRYRVQFLTTASHAVEVEASSLEEARERADDAFDVGSLCHYCARQIELGDWEQDATDDGVWEV